MILSSNSVYQDLELSADVHENTTYTLSKYWIWELNDNFPQIDTIAKKFTCDRTKNSDIKENLMHIIDVCVCVCYHSNLKE